MGMEIKLDMNSLFKLCGVLISFYQARKNDEEINLDNMVDQVAAALGIDDVNAFIQEGIENGLKGAVDDQCANEIAGIVAGMCKPLANLILDFVKSGGSPEVLINGLNGIYFDNVDDLSHVLEKALGIDEIPENVKALLEKYSLATVSFYCFAAAYKIYRKAADDAQLAHDQRIEIERQCAEAVAQLQARRAEMDALVNKYMLNRLEPFKAGVAAMDQAVLDDDDDGYIKANAQLWELLGRESQYRSAAEFDDLMQSDETFKL